ncbi:putative nucleotide-diphospho-sugar transferase [Roseitranquillus sediminis]|uniref:putative nucleotide-diphospho-sugar transferase n=1 Tax=Roseitranquillus sediminis TaxID=2809051 RepID=UPI001D0CAB39|nr:putative nucleotide-diphospho-sugar transferase [Roseitranquillus sediminis]MBM9593291.1 hypothetical protein [Roseitranquillus sediminis]
MLKRRSISAVICYICYGDATAALGRLSMATLAAQGWSGDIVVLTERSRDWPDVPRLREVVVPPEVVHIDVSAPFMGAEVDCRDYSSPSPALAAKHLTPLIYRWLEMSRHDIAIYIDADVVANRSPDECAGRLLERPYDFGVGRNKKRLRSTRASRVNLSWFELQKWRHAPNINSGLFFFKPTRTGMDVMKAWEFETRRRLGGDQAALQAVFLRQFRSEIDVLGFEYQDFGPMPHKYSGDAEALQRSDGYFVHFRGASGDDRPMVDYVRRHIPEALEIAGMTA